MKENMMNSDHKGTNQKSRDGWQQIFDRPGQHEECIICEVLVSQRPESCFMVWPVEAILNGYDLA